MTNRFMVAIGLALVACGTGQSKSGTGTEGQVRVSTKTRVSALSTGGPPDVCGTLSLQPYSLDAGGNMTFAGLPVTLDSSASAGTDAILGCIDDGQTGNNWGYLVTASGWNNCASPAVLYSAMTPAITVLPSVITGNFPVHCSKSLDTALPISLNVSIATPNNAGYIDLSVSVDASAVQTGCKIADISATTGNLNFGESYIDPKGLIHQGLVGLDGTGTPLQYAGTVTPGLPTQDTFYTGQVSTIPSLLFQTFLDKCETGAEYGDVNHAQCITTVEGTTPTTSNALADVFLADAAWGYASASLNGAGGIQIYWNGTAGANIMSVPLGAGPNFNDVQSITLPPRTAPAHYTGIFLDRSTPHQFLVTGVNAAGVPGYAVLSLIAGAWTLGAGAALPSLEQQACLGLFHEGGTGCFTPKSCAPTAPVLSAEQCKQAEGSLQTFVSSQKCNNGTAGALFTPAIENSVCNEGFYLCMRDVGRAGGNYQTYLNGFVQANSGDCSTALPITQACTVSQVNGAWQCTCIPPPPPPTPTALAGCVTAWGPNNSATQVSSTPQSTDIFTKARGKLETLMGIREDGTLAAWGENQYGQVSDVPAGTGFREIAVGTRHMLALREDGSIAAWGSDLFGETTAKPSGGGYIGLAAGSMSSAALRADGSMQLWGLVTDPGDCGGTGFTKVDLGNAFGVALRQNGSFCVFGRDYKDGTFSPPSGAGFVDVAANDRWAVGVRSDGTLASWGDDTSGTVSQTPAGNGFVAAAAGGTIGSALKADGSIVVWGGAATWAGASSKNFWPGNTEWRDATPPAPSRFLTLTTSYDDVFGVRTDCNAEGRRERSPQGGSTR